MCDFLVGKPESFQWNVRITAVYILLVRDTICFKKNIKYILRNRSFFQRNAKVAKVDLSK